ncbi:aldo/keto reductase [Murimonas intestini]|uniref:aldo/keto reductase n=1 Tax=Murimonas intestini TaxID=1337051 RepID=UPI0011DD7514|nr:aldo/keto reductase [Murimonas intestini]
MRTMNLGRTKAQVPVIAVGCMRLNGLEEREAERFINGAMELGLNFFDHADIYGKGACEELFAKAVHMDSRKREKMILQSKCGIRPGVAFDFSKKYILESVDGILKRLDTEYLDVLVLHRPDALMEPEEVAEVFDSLEQSGKVRHFGVSNQKPMQIQLLQKYVKQPVAVDQLQFGICHAGMITQGIHVNMEDDAAADRDGSVLDFCRLNDITIQAWSPFQYGYFDGVFFGSEKYPKLNKVIDETAENYGVSATTIAAAWILRHPAGIQIVSGTMNAGRLEEIAQAADIRLTREEWYRIYMAAGNILP